MGKVAPGEQHPRDVLSVITFLRENRPLSVMEFDRLIKYLVHRREQMLRAEYGDAIPAHLAVPPLGPQSDPASRVREEALRKRVFGLLTAPPPRDILSQEPSSSYASHGPVDPTLQKAIDSLIT